MGDVGINGYGIVRDSFLKAELSKLPFTLFCVRENHEERLEHVGTYREMEWKGGKVYVEEAYPNLIFAKDGEIYDIAGKKTMVIGGAYSVDKWQRSKMNYKWFAGHFHCDRRVVKLQIMFRKVELFCNDTDLNFSME